MTLWHFENHNVLHFAVEAGSSQSKQIIVICRVNKAEQNIKELGLVLREEPFIIVV
ncbi:hypothetical protein [Corynebacterium callunae]|uniref:hypothetical protein n=1 Tax=Corynebacterium callunae TaxID=1721 RepID=UPI00034AAD71|nr:hypothetical protein [Corynebacterium callunae]